LLTCDAGDGVSRCDAGDGGDHAKKPRSNFAAASISLKFVLSFAPWVALWMLAANLPRTKVLEKSPAPEC
jgi:hypothetical protein